jgi:hypothetical protein
VPAGEPFDEQPVPERPRTAMVAARRILYRRYLVIPLLSVTGRVWIE